MQDISDGDTFKQNGKIYMKIYNEDKADKNTYGVDIETGEVSKFNKKTKVIPVSVKCSISMNN